jgi:hypothetical protein
MREESLPRAHALGLADRQRCDWLAPA